MTRCPHGNCEHGWPAPDAEGRAPDFDSAADAFVEGMERDKKRRAAGSIAEQEWDDYANDMNRLPVWNEGI